MVGWGGWLGVGGWVGGWVGEFVHVCRSWCWKARWGDEEGYMRGVRTHVHVVCVFDCV